MMSFSGIDISVVPHQGTIALQVFLYSLSVSSTFVSQSLYATSPLLSSPYPSLSHPFTAAFHRHLRFSPALFLQIPGFPSIPMSFELQRKNSSRPFDFCFMNRGRFWCSWKILFRHWT
ncbi:unnamed protein product [Citrullus colocynthis]|uniref:Uncharacterized protein n=1 Tax=Citrullus colocynthis TaxID=252529 RepID=A0ABP0YKT6_9ROSI